MRVVLALKSIKVRLMWTFDDFYFELFTDPPPNKKTKFGLDLRKKFSLKIDLFYSGLFKIEWCPLEKLQNF